MISALLERLRQQHRTAAYPLAPPKVSDRLRGLPVIDGSKCESGCTSCVDDCPTDSVSMKETVGPDGAVSRKFGVDLGSCLFCNECQSACPTGSVTFTPEYRLAVRKREDLFRTEEAYKLAQQLDDKMLKLFGRSLKLRQVSAGGCNGCEADVNVLTTVVFDLGRFGIQFVASPRHADGLLITGPVTKNMEYALKIAYDALPTPKIVIACGACACSGGPYKDHDQQVDGADSVVPVDLYIPGCPPHPWTILDGLLRLMGRLPDEQRIMNK